MDVGQYLLDVIRVKLPDVVGGSKAVCSQRVKLYLKVDIEGHLLADIVASGQFCARSNITVPYLDTLMMKKSELVKLCAYFKSTLKGEYVSHWDCKSYSQSWKAQNYSVSIPKS
eukprot:11534783-Ditylum_brightwellii.AAC.2